MKESIPEINSLLTKFMGWYQIGRHRSGVLGIVRIGLWSAENEKRTNQSDCLML